MPGSQPHNLALFLPPPPSHPKRVSPDMLEALALAWFGLRPTFCGTPNGLAAYFVLCGFGGKVGPRCPNTHGARQFQDLLALRSDAYTLTEEWRLRNAVAFAVRGLVCGLVCGIKACKKHDCLLIGGQGSCRKLCQLVHVFSFARIHVLNSPPQQLLSEVSILESESCSSRGAAQIVHVGNI